MHDVVKHIVTGGWWYDSRANVRAWVQAGPAIREYVANHPHMGTFLGVPPAPKEKAIG